MTPTRLPRSRSPLGWDHPVDHPMFDGTDREKLARVLAAAPVRRLEAGDAVGLPNGPAQLHLVLRGLLRCYRLASHGRQLLLELTPAGGFDGLIQLSGRQGHYTVAAEASIVVSLSPEILRRAFAADPQVATNLVWAAAHRLALREQQIEAIATHDAVLGVAGIFLLLAERHSTANSDLPLMPDQLTHQTIAEMLGVRRETVTAAMRQLRTLGAVRKIDGRYVVDTGALEDLVGV